LITELANKRCILSLTGHYENSSQYKKSAISEAVVLIKTYFKPDPQIAVEKIHEQDYILLLSAAINSVLDIKPVDILPNKPLLPFGRVVAWGVKGRRGKSLLPTLSGTIMEPTEMWDIAGDNVCIHKPDLASLNANDLVIIMPTNDASILAALRETDCMVLKSDKVIDFLSSIKYPQFYDGSLSLAL
jgi:hypothetical protein